MELQIVNFCNICPKKLKFLPNEIKDIVVKLAPLSFGNMKLPPFKEMEFSFEKEEEKICSIYYYPDYIQFQPLILLGII